MLSHLDELNASCSFVLVTTIIFCLTLMSFICPEATRFLLSLAESFPLLQLFELDFGLRTSLSSYLFFICSNHAAKNNPMVRSAALLILSLQSERF